MPRRSKREKQALSIFESSDYPISPLMLSQELGITKGAARILLKRMVDKGLIRRESRGFYVHAQAIERHDVQLSAPLRLHGLKLVTIKGHGLAGVMAQQLLNSAPVNIHKHRINHSITFNEEWEGRKVTFTLHKGNKERGTKERIEVNLTSTNSPLDFPSFAMFCGYLQGKIPAATLEAWQISQIGLNFDLLGMQIDGAEAITLQAFKNMWLRLYNHNKDMLRVEAHLNLAVNLSEGIDILKAAMVEAERLIMEKPIYTKKK